MSKEKTKSISIYLTDEEFIFLAKKAHKLDITFNQLCNKILEEQLDKLEKSCRVSGKPTEGIESELALTKPRSGKAGTRGLAKVPRKLSGIKRA